MPQHNPDVELANRFIEDMIGSAEGADARARERQMEEEDALFVQRRQREALAAYAHEAWAGWMRYLFGQSWPQEDGTVTIPAASVARWRRQASTPYADLPEDEKRSDRAEADKMLALMKEPA